MVLLVKVVVMVAANSVVRAESKAVGMLGVPVELEAVPDATDHSKEMVMVAVALVVKILIA